VKIQNVPLSLSVGILATLWTYASVTLGWPTWAAFISWAFFFVAGADAKAIIKAGFPILVGVLFGYACLYGLKLGEGGIGVLGVSIAVGVAAFLLVLLMNWEPLALASAAFGGFAVFFAFTFGYSGGNIFALSNVGYSLLTLFIGLGLGYLSVSIPGWIGKA
jgi:hypothetical protein